MMMEIVMVNGLDNENSYGCDLRSGKAYGNCNSSCGGNFDRGWLNSISSN